MFYKMWRQEFNSERFALLHCPPEDFTVSCLQKTRRILPIWVAYRAILFLYFLVTYLYAAIPVGKNIADEDKFKFFIFLTNWTYTIEFIQFGIAFLIVAMRYAKEKKDPAQIRLGELPCLYKFYWLLFTTTLPSSVVVTIIFWASVYDPVLFPANATNIILHASNSAFMLLDFTLVGHPVRFLHFYFPALYGIFYGLFSIIYYACGGTGIKGLIPIYKILDWRDPKKAIVTCTACLFFVLFLHCLFCLLSMCKFWLKKQGEDENCGHIRERTTQMP